MRPVAFASRLRRWTLGFTAVAASAGATGCYSLTPLDPQPAPGRTVQVDLTDEGRYQMRGILGPDAEFLRGRVARTTGDTIAIATTFVSTLRGDDIQWTGEVVGVPRAYVARMRERKLDPVKTGVMAGTFSTLVGVFIATRGFGVFGGDLIPTEGGGGGPQPGT